MLNKYVKAYISSIWYVGRMCRGSLYAILYYPKKPYCLKDIQVYRHEVDTTSIKKRGEQVLENNQIGTNEISGSIETGQREWLFLSILYSSGWKAYIDGEQTQIQKADVGFMAISIPEGNMKFNWYIQHRESELEFLLV